MKIEEYREALIKIDEMAKKAKAELAFNYAIANNPYKEGDIVHDGQSIIIIKESDVRISSGGGVGTPTCVFRGPMVDNNGQILNEKDSWKEVWQTNILEHLHK